MADIKDTVGEGGANRMHDVALVQAMLRIVKNAAGMPYLAGNYDGSYGDKTKAAILAFQTEQKVTPADFVAAGAKVLSGLSKAAAMVPAAHQAQMFAGAALNSAVVMGSIGNDRLGLVSKSGPAITRLNSLLPADRKELHVIENTKTVYIEDSVANMGTSSGNIASDAEFEPVFRVLVSTLVQLMYSQHRIVLWLTPTGRRRTFAQQAAEVNTNAGPGESNHNFGRAVDLGFKHFRWIQGDGTVKKDADWLNALETADARKANALWDVRDVIARALGLHRLDFERVHLQAFRDPTVSSPKSLVQLLNTVGTMKWDVGYKSDLGFGGALFPVGTAKQIWAETGPLTKQTIAQAQSAATGTAVKAADITAAEVTALRRALKGDFELADANWIKWTAVAP